MHSQNERVFQDQRFWQTPEDAPARRLFTCDQCGAVASYKLENLLILKDPYLKHFPGGEHILQGGYNRGVTA